MMTMATEHNNHKGAVLKSSRIFYSKNRNGSVPAYYERRLDNE